MYTIEAFRVVRKGSTTTTIRTFSKTVETKQEAEQVARRVRGAIITTPYQPNNVGDHFLLGQKVRGTWRGVTSASRRFRPPYDGFQIRKW